MQSICLLANYPPLFFHCTLPSTSVAFAVARQFTATPSSLQTGDVPSMNISFIPGIAVAGSGTVTLAVSGSGAVAGLQVFAAATPAQAGVVIVGLPNCTGATAAINTANQTLTITLPSSCTLAAKVSVRIEIRDAFFAPNAAIGTTVALSLTTSASTVPSIAPGYTIGVWQPALALVRVAWPRQSPAFFQALWPA